MAMQQYLDLLRLILEQGKDREDRTGTGTRGVFGHQMRFDLREGFPLADDEEAAPRSRSSTSCSGSSAARPHVKPLQDARRPHLERVGDRRSRRARFGRKEGDLGPVYGHQWRNFGATRSADGTYANDGVDQIKRAARTTSSSNPHSRRLIVTGWNPKEADQVALPPCHTLFQFYVQDGELCCQLYQRSADVFLGVPFNIASYALLTMMIAHVTDLQPGDFVHTFGDAHLYKNHLEQAQLQLDARAAAAPDGCRSTRQRSDLFAFRFEDFTLEGYDPHPHIAAEVSV